MKPILLLAFALAVPAAAHAQLYKWVDKNGRVTYSDQPSPAQASKQLNVSPGPAAPQKSALEVDKDREKIRQAEKDKSKVSDEAAKKAQADQENCNRAKAGLATVTAGGRIATYDAKGEPTFLTDEQIEAERVKAQKTVDEACKSP